MAPPPTARPLVIAVVSARAVVAPAARPVSAVVRGVAVFALDDHLVVVAVVAVDEEGEEL